MIVRFRLPSGLEIFGFPTENFYSGDWDLGPTWNYAVMADTPFLVDAGRYGQGPQLLKMMDTARIRPSEFGCVLISHGHEDHDGGLAELVDLTHLKVKAHPIYALLIQKYPSMAPAPHKLDFPAKCWHCFMPESFYSAHCLKYHQVLQDLAVEPVGEGASEIGHDINVHHLPGHSPDSLAVFLGEEAVIVGDTLLPQITPWPTRLEMYKEIAGVIGHLYPDPGAIFGLECYVRSLKILRKIGSEHPEIKVFPAHRFYYGGTWNTFDLVTRIDELLAHHVQRCADIIDIVTAGTSTLEAIVRQHFPSSLLKGPGKHMAMNEIQSHCELMVGCGDLRVREEDKGYESTGSHYFETLITVYGS